MGSQKTSCQFLTDARDKIEEAARIAADDVEAEFLARLTVERTARVVAHLVDQAWWAVQARFRRSSSVDRYVRVRKIFSKRLARLQRGVAGDRRFERFPEAHRELQDALDDRNFGGAWPVDIDLIEV